MNAPQSLLLVTTALALLFGACGVSDQSQEADVSVIGSAQTVAGGSGTEGMSIGKINGGETTELTCNSCYVRCTANDVDLCRWTKAYDTGGGRTTDCGGKGDKWCKMRGYEHSWAGCNKAQTEYSKSCCCDPNGYCSRC